MKQTRRPTGLILEELEPRILMSADLAPLGADTLATPAVQQVAPAAATASPEATEQRRLELVIVDASVPDADALIQSLQAQESAGRTLLIVKLDPAQDVLAQIDAVLQNLQNPQSVSALHLVTHGDGEGLQIGSTRLAADTLAEHFGLIAGWAGSFTQDADLLLYGCDLASTQAGRELADQLALLTGTDVAASTDKTGSALLGADWTLEYQRGPIETDVVAEAPAQVAWQGTLATLTFQEGVSGYTGTQDTMINPAATGTSYGSDTSFVLDDDDNRQILIRFDNLFGNGASQIPVGSTITSATLYINVNATDSGETASIYRMLATWSESSTWASMSGGVSTNGTEAASSASSSLDTGSSGVRSFTNLAAAVQAWANGEANYGWMIQGDDAAWGFYSSEYGTAGNRPYLSVTYTPPTPPSLDLDANNSSGATGNDYSGAFTEGTAASVADASDAALTAGTAANMSGMTVTLTNRPNGTAESLAANTGGTSITASYDSGTGVLTLSGTDTAAHYQQVLRSLTYNNSSDTPDTTARSISIVVTDAYGQTASATSTLSVTAVNDAPVVGTSGGSAGFTENGSAVAVDGSLAVSDADHTSLAGATVQITGNYANGQDTLSFTNQSGITGSWDAATGTLTLSGAATVAQYQAALRSITYSNSSENPSTLTRTVSFRVNDGSTNSAAATRTITVAAVNDAPVITSNGGGTSASISVAENATAVTTVAASDADGPSLTYSISGGADAALFTINSSTGALSFVSGPNFEAPGDAGGNNVYDVIVQVSDGSLTDTQTLAVTVTDVDEFNVGAVTDSNGAANSVAENTANGTAVGITAATSDADGTNNTITYSLSDDAGGRFAINSSTGVVTVANGSALNYESATSHSITVLATSADGSTSSQSFTINLTDADEFDVGAVTDTNGAANSVAENTTNGTAVGITASASDADATTNSITYTLSDDSGGRFAINSSTGVVTVANSGALDYESATSHSITVLATSADGSTSSQSFTINLTDADEFDVGAVTDANGAANSVTENAANGTAVGITASASDADGTTNAITYSLSDNAGGRFAINASTGVVTVANSGGLDYEAATSHSITVLATSADGSTSSQSFTVNLTDVDEFDVGAVTDSNGAANSVTENTANGTAVGITASASDADGTTNAITYSLSDNAGGRFAINASTGVVTVANSTALDYESATSHSITVLATSADGSTSSQSFTINLTDADEFDVGSVTDSNAAANSIAENAANGTAVGITASASDADATTNAITYSLSDSAGGRFAINSSTGVVTVANSGALDYESATSHSITVLATSADGSTSSQSFTINLTDADEFDVGAVTDSNGAANSVAENATNGTAVGITASASDADGTTNAITYSLSDNAGGRFAINSSTGIVTVANSSALDYESATSHSITVLATSADGSTSSQSFTINLTDADEFDVGAVTDSNGAANSVAENAANGTAVGITASASDADGTTNAITYSLSDNAGGRFAIDSSTGVVTVANSSSLDYESATSHSITVLATSADGSTSSQSFTINLTDADEFDVGAVTDSNATANSVAENAADGSLVGITASASDADATNHAITYSLSDNAGGRFAIDSATGVVTIANSGALDYESATSHNITVLATSADGSTSSQSFTINLTDVDEFDVGVVTDSNGAANSVAENSANGTAVGITASASDADGTTSTITYSLSDNAGGRFSINSSTGVITVANGGALDYESATSHSITVLATSADGSTSSQSFTINLTDADEFDVGAVTDSNGAANSVTENAANGTAVGITASASDADGTTNVITYSLSDNAGGRFAIDSSTGVVTVANSSSLDYESATSHSITVLATSADGSTSSQSFTINLTDADEFDVGAVTDSNATANSVTENAADGSLVGITASASDADATNHAITYTLSDNAGGRFAIDSATGVVTVANSSALNYESATSHSITVLATSADGSTSSQSFTINLTDADEFDVGAVTDSNGAANSVAENAANGTAVGITAAAADADATTNTVTYSLSDDAGGRFAIDASSGVVTVADGSQLDFESATSHGITVLATSADGSTSSQSFTISLIDRGEASLGAASDANAGANLVAENATNGSTVGLTVQAIDPDVIDSVSYSLSDDAGGRFAIDSSTGVVTVLDGSLLDRESATSHAITVLATSTDGSTSGQTFTINLTDVDESDVGAVTDANGAANSVAENAANGSVVGITASASDADATHNTVTYSLTDDAGGRFAIDASTGIVTVASSGALDYESATSHSITVLATSADGSTSSQSFTINLTDADEFDVGAVTDANGAANSVAENAANGTAVGITASASDADATTNTVTYSLSDDAGGRFAIDAATGVVTVANSGALDHEAATSHSITVLATSADGSTSSQSFTINLTDADEFDVGTVTDANGAANSVAENAANGTAVGITASASDADATTNTVTYSLSDSAGGRFAIDAATGVVTVANSGALDHEAATSHSITVLATSADGSTSSQSFTINLTDADKFDVGAVTDGNAAANSVAENAANGTAVGITASASDADGSNNAITYSLSDNAGGRFAIDAATGVVTIANSAALDYESATSHSITVLATSADGSSSSQTFTINLADADEFDIGAVTDSNGAPNSVAENAANGALVGVTTSASDADATLSTISYTLTDNAGGRFAIDGATGVVTVADGSLLNFEAATSHSITVLATSADGSSSSQVIAIALADVNEFAVGPISDDDTAVESVAEGAARGTQVGFIAAAQDADGSNNALTYSLDDDAGGRFAIHAGTGVVTVADGSRLDFEASSTHQLIVRATSADGSSSTQALTIALTDVNEPAPRVRSLPTRPEVAAPEPAAPESPAVPADTPREAQAASAAPNDEGDTPSAPSSDNASNATATGLPDPLQPPSGTGRDLGIHVTDSASSAAGRTGFSWALRAGAAADSPGRPAAPVFALARLIQPDWGALPRGEISSGLLGTEALLAAPPSIEWEGAPGTGFFGGPNLAAGIQVSGMALSVGMVWWATRFTGLLAGLMATSPAWRTLDPLPILGNPDDEKETGDMDHADDLFAEHAGQPIPVQPPGQGIAS